MANYCSLLNRKIQKCGLDQWSPKDCYAVCYRLAPSGLQSSLCKATVRLLGPSMLGQLFRHDIFQHDVPVHTTEQFRELTTQFHSDNCTAFKTWRTYNEALSRQL